MRLFPTSCLRPEGKRTERVVRAPVSTLQNILLTPEDEQDLRDVQPFVLTTKEIPLYNIRYLGREKLDEIPTLFLRGEAQEAGAGQALLRRHCLGG